MPSGGSNQQQVLTAVATGVAVVASVAIFLFPDVPRSVARAVTTLASRLHFKVVVLAGKSPSGSGAGSSSSAAVVGRKGTVSHLFIHPVKSLRPVPRDVAVIGPRGFRNDRRFMVVYPAPVPLTGEFGPDDATHRFLSQRQCPSLATVTADLDVERGTITLSSDKLPGEQVTFSTCTEPYAPKYRSALWRDVVSVEDAGDGPAVFLQKLIRTDSELIDEIRDSGGIRLVAQSIDDLRVADDNFTPLPARSSILKGGRPPAVALSDGFPILIASEASLLELNRRLEVKGKPKLPMSRFRPNIVIGAAAAADGDTEVLEPFEEDRWKVIRIGDVVFHVVKPCPRCKESCTDQLTGEVTSEPVATLREFRALDPSNSENVYFAQNAIPDVASAGKSIRIGDGVEVLQWGDPIYSD